MIGPADATPAGTAVPPLTRGHLDGTVVDRLRQVAAAAPGAEAVCGAEQRLCYGEFDALSDAVAARVVAFARGSSGGGASGGGASGGGVGPVPVLLGHDVSAVVALVGVLKAGRAVVPLDATVPAERLSSVREIVSPAVCVTDAAHAALARAAGFADSQLLDLTSCPPAPPPDVAVTARDDASVIFTSGSTGVPKGVVGDHRMFVHGALSAAGSLGHGPGDRIALVLPLSFGAGVGVAAWGLLTGASLHVLDPRSATPAAVLAFLADERVDALHATPSLLRALQPALRDRPDALRGLRLVSSGGEPAFGADLRALQPYLSPECRFVNRAGSSEAGTFAQWVHRVGQPVPDGPLPAGHPVSDTTVRIERPDGSPADPGEVGDLAVTSAFLGRRYWAQPDLTAARFTPEPDGRTTVRAGDLGLLRADGVLEFRGRRDSAVKIRGQLVEPVEVEAALRAEEAVGDACVVAVPRVPGRPEEGLRLVAYVVPAGNRPVVAPELRRGLLMRLPAAMVPGTVVPMATLPRTERGKVDRSALPPPPPVTRANRPPRSHYERVLLEIWAEVLEVEPGVHDDFFELGGDSLAAEVMLASVATELQVDLPTAVLAEAPTVEALALRVVAGVDRGRRGAVRLSAPGPGTPLFCVAGGGGIALAFAPLARHLPGRAVYALQAHGLEGRGLPDWTVRAAARRHARDIRRVQPHGPYLLAGHSFGGFVALEVAHLLTAAGEQVDCIALLDCRRPTGSPAEPDGTPPDLSAGAEETEVLPRRSPAERVRRAGHLLLSGVVPREGVQQYSLFHRQSRWVLRAHRPRPWAGRAVAVTTRSPAGGEVDWSGVLTGPTTVRQVPGGHSTVLREPYVARLADALLEAFPDGRSTAVAAGAG